MYIHTVYMTLRPSAVIQSRHYNNNLFAFCICIAFMPASATLSFFLLSLSSFCFNLSFFFLFFVSPASFETLLCFHSFLIKIIWWLQFSWVALVANCCRLKAAFCLFVLHFVYGPENTHISHFPFLISPSHSFLHFLWTELNWTLKRGSIIYYCYISVLRCADLATL